MNKYRVFVLAIALTILSCPGYTNATLLGTIEYSNAGQLLGDFLDEINLSMCYPLPTQNGSDLSISLSWNVTEDDVGKTFLASTDTHQNFDVFTSFLTNGFDDLLYLSDVVTSIGGFPATHPESVLINGIQDGVDFQGYTIDSIGLTINELSLDYHAGTVKKGHLYPGTTDFTYDITYTINGTQVPEPATLFLLGFGSLLLRKKR